MKILHVVGGDLTKGAFKGAYSLHEGLIDAGVESRITGFVPGHQVGRSVSSFSSSRSSKLFNLFLQNQDTLWWPFYRGRTSTGFNSGVLGRNLERHQDLNNCDVVHVHWASNGVINPRSIGRLRVPVVLSLRDMWFFTGGCHYSMACDRYSVGCGACPQLGSVSSKDISFWLSRYKNKHLQKKHIEVVGISNWVSQCAMSSSVFSGKVVHTIPNCVDTNSFSPIEKRFARDLLGLPYERPIVLVGASSVASFYKGWDYFVDSIVKIKAEDVCVVTFGANHSASRLPSSVETKHLGYLHDELTLRVAYSAADVFVAPSVQEAFGKTLVESMACGTPVACFDATGPASIVDHKVTGYKARPFSSEDLANGIDWILNNGRSSTIKKSCRERAVNHFSKEVVAERHIELYHSLI